MPKSSRQAAASAVNTAAASGRGSSRVAATTASSVNSSASANGFALIGCAIAHAVTSAPPSAGSVPTRSRRILYATRVTAPFTSTRTMRQASSDGAKISFSAGEQVRMPGPVRPREVVVGQLAVGDARGRLERQPLVERVDAAQDRERRHRHRAGEHGGGDPARASRCLSQHRCHYSRLVWRVPRRANPRRRPPARRADCARLRLGWLLRRRAHDRGRRRLGAGRDPGLHRRAAAASARGLGGDRRSRGADGMGGDIALLDAAVRARPGRRRPADRLHRRADRVGDGMARGARRASGRARARGRCRWS